MTRRDGVAASSYHAAVKPHPRIRRFFKWGGVVVSVVLLTVWVGSAYGQNVRWVLPHAELTLFKGSFVLTQILDGQQLAKQGLQFMKPHRTGFLWSFHYYRRSVIREVGIPLWPFVLASIATTAAAWRMDTLAQRRIRLGVCPACGYDRAGLAAGAPCPECNAKA